MAQDEYRLRCKKLESDLSSAHSLLRDVSGLFPMRYPTPAKFNVAVDSGLVERIRKVVGV
jgi:hypothetical protein